MGALRTFLISFVVVVVVILAMLSLTGSFISATNPNSDILSSRWGINSSTSSLNSTLFNFTNDVNIARTSINGSSPSPTDYVFLIVRESWSIPLGFIGLIVGGLSAISSIIFPAFGGNALGTLITGLIAVVFAILSISGILYILKAIRTGETER